MQESTEIVKYPSEGVKAELFIHRYKGECLDTLVTLTGQFSVSGADRLEFLDKLGQLIDKYRI